MVGSPLVGSAEEHGVLGRSIDRGLNHRLQICQAVQQRSVNLWPGAQTKEILDVDGRDALWRKQVRHLVGYRDRPGERAHRPHCWPYCLKIGPHRHPRQRADRQGNARKMLQVRATQCSVRQRERMARQQGECVDRAHGIALAAVAVGPRPFAQQGHPNFREGGEITRAQCAVPMHLREILTGTPCELGKSDGEVHISARTTGEHLVCPDTQRATDGRGSEAFTPARRV